MRCPTLFILPCLLLILHPAVQAQGPPSPGTLVRITSPEIPQGRTVGVFERLSGDSVVVAGRPISRTSITQFEVSAGRKSHTGAGMALGFLLGAGLGAASGAIGCPEGDEDNIKAICAVVFGAGGGGLGLLVGGIIGSTRHSDRWRTVPLSTLRITPTVGPNGTIGVRFGLRL